MKLLKNKLPLLKPNRIFLNEDKNIDINELKLTIYNNQNNGYISKTPLNLRNIISPINVKKNKTEKLKSLGVNSVENIHDQNYLIKKFLYRNINSKKYLKPIKQLSKSNSSLNLKNNKYRYFLKDNENDKSNNKLESNNKDSITFILFNKFNKNLGTNLNLNKITNINRYLIKENENDTNGNLIYDDYNEEKKESITFIINRNNSREFLKKRLTKKFPDNKIINHNNKIFDDFKFYGKRFNSPGIKNIRRIKYLQEIIQQKSNSNKNNDNNKRKNLKDKFSNKYNSILKDKLENMKNKIKKKGKNLLEMDGLLQSCVNEAKKQFDIETKNIFGEAYS